jgi:NADH-quinone oxidoreductase subunit M
MPKYAFVFMVFMLASVGLPSTSGFVGEVLVLFGAFQVNTWVCALAATGMVLGAAYMLVLYRRVIFGKLERADLKSILDINPREVAVFAPLVFLVFLMGVFPNIFLKPVEPSVAELIKNFNAQRTASATLETGSRQR